jgi:replicative DNA helicase
VTDVFDETDVRSAMAGPDVVAAEMAVLGAAIQAKAAVETAGETLDPQDFFRGAHQLIYEAAYALAETGKEVEPTAVLGELTRRSTAERVGGAPYLHTLMQHAEFATLPQLAAAVRDDAARRRVNAVGPLIGQVTARPDFDPEAHVDMIRQRLDAAVARITGDRLPTIGELVLARVDEIGNQTPRDFVELPWVDLEMMLGGLRPGQLIVIGARPSVGKSVVALDVARHAAIRRGTSSLMFSLEMGGEEIAERALAAEAKVLLHLIRTNQLTDADWLRIARRQDSIQSAPLIIDESGECSLGRIRARLRGMARSNPARLVIVDYLQLMQPPKADSKEQQVAALTRGLKLLAKEFAVPIVVLSQLNRESTKRSDRRPMMSELRDSGAIEQDADVVILLHRDDVEDKEVPRAGEMDLIVAKNRNGPTGTVTVAFQGHYARAMDMAHEWSPAAGLTEAQEDAA